MNEKIACKLVITYVDSLIGRYDAVVVDTTASSMDTDKFQLTNEVCIK